MRNVCGKDARLKHLSGWYLWLLVTLVSSSGASCRHLGRPTGPLTPVAFAGPPTLEEIIYTVNSNSAKIQQISTESATLSASGAPAALRATMSIERPLKIRLRGRLIGQELDLGSNDELFWFWVKSDPENALYYSYHEQFVQSAANRVLPVGPDWLIEAIGLVNLDPAGVHEGPTQRADGNWEIYSRIDRGGTGFNRTLVVNGKYGWIAEQRVTDLAGRPLAVSRCSNYRFYPEAGASLPHRVQIELPSAQMSFQLEVGKYAINQLSAEAGQLFALPHFDGYRLVNLADQGVPETPQEQPASSVYLPQSPDETHTAYRLKYRGYGGTR